MLDTFDSTGTIGADFSTEMDRFEAKYIIPRQLDSPPLSLHRAKEREATHRFRLRVLLKTAEGIPRPDRPTQPHPQPLMEQLGTDLAQMDTGRPEQLRDLLSIRERILDVALQTTEATCKKERIAVDLAEEPGSLER